jgi:hypothetical protein
MKFIGIIISMAAYLAIATVWFRVIFVKKYEQMGAMDVKVKPALREWIGALVNAFLVSVVMCWLITAAGITNIGEGLFLATALFAGFIFPPYALNMRFQKQPYQTPMIEAGYMLVAMWVISVILIAI